MESMRTHGLRASWIATTFALVITVGAPLVSGAMDGPADVSSGRSTGLVLAGVRASAEIDERAAPSPDTTPSRARNDHRPAGPRSTLDEREGTTGPGRRRRGHDAIRLEVLRGPDHGMGRGDGEPRPLGSRGDPVLWPRREGWIPLRDLARTTTHVQVHVDLSDHRVTVTKFGHRLFGLPAATGAPISPTPPGEYFVTDRIPFPSGGSLGTFAFGISGIQPNLPPGWSGGNQLAIHGTSDPASIGTSASAGCMRVSEQGLDRLLALLKLGTPVIVQP